MTSPEFTSIDEVHAWAKAEGYTMRANLWQKPDHYLYIERLPSLMWRAVQADYGTGTPLNNAVMR